MMKVTWDIPDEIVMEAEDFRCKLQVVLPDVPREAIDSLPVNPVLLAMAFRGIGWTGLDAVAEDINRSTMLLRQYYQGVSHAEMQALLGKAESPEDLRLLAELAGKGEPFEVLLNTPLYFLGWVLAANVLSHAFDQAAIRAGELATQLSKALRPILDEVGELPLEDPVAKARAISKKDLDNKRRMMRGKRRL